MVIHSIKRIESFLDVSSDHLTPNDPSFSTLTPLCPLLLGMFPLLLLPTLLNYVFMWDHNDMQHPPTRSLGFPIRLIGVIGEALPSCYTMMMFSWEKWRKSFTLHTISINSRLRFCFKVSVVVSCPLCSFLYIVGS